MGAVICAISTLQQSEKKKKVLAVFLFVRLLTEPVEMELINIAIRHTLGPRATSTHF